MIETKKVRDVTRAPSKGPKPGGIRHGLLSGDRKRQNPFLCYVYGGKGLRSVLLFEECCVFKFFKISRFLPTADTHTSTSLHEASREIQEQGSNLWACHRRTWRALLRRPQQQRLLQWLRACTRRSTGTLQQSPQPLRYRFLSWDVKSIPNKVYIDIYLTLCGLQATHRPTLAGLLFPSCLIVVSLWMVCETAAQHAGRRRLPVQSRLY